MFEKFYHSGAETQREKRRICYSAHSLCSGPLWLIFIPENYSVEIYERLETTAHKEECREFVIPQLVG